MEIVLILLFFVFLLLCVTWLPFFKQDQTQQQADEVKDTQSGIRKQTNIELYHEHKGEIERDFSQGAIDEESYQYLKAELDNSLLQDIDNDETVATNIKKSNFSVIWPLGLTLVIVGFAVSLYSQQGSFQRLLKQPIANQDSQQALTPAQQLTKYISEMGQYLKENPDDGKAWYNFGQTLVGAGVFEQAITAFEQVIRIEGEHADLLGAIAQATYYKNNQQLDQQVQALIDRALALDINDPATNILLGMHNFIDEQYQASIGYWQRAIDSKQQGVNVSALQDAINEARTRLGLPVVPRENTVAANSAATSTRSESNSIASNGDDEAQGPKLQVSVSLGEQVLQQLALSEDKVVFVYALATSGKRMPLAAVKIMTSDLPTSITLSNAQAMSPQHNLASVEQVNIFAIISKQGSVGIKPGDFKGEVQHISVDSTDVINIVIDSLVE